DEEHSNEGSGINSDMQKGIMRLLSMLTIFVWKGRIFVAQDSISLGLNTVVKEWNGNIHGCQMFKLVKNLKILKKPLNKLNLKHANLFEKAKSLKLSLQDAQSKVDKDPCNVIKRKTIFKLLEEYTAVASDELKLLHQKAKIDWLMDGDKNTTYFYNMLKDLTSGIRARSWYETVANYLLENGFHRGKIDQTLFIKRQKCDILLVQIYIDDIIFGSTNKDLCKSFENHMKEKFQMSSMGELTFFLGLQLMKEKFQMSSMGELTFFLGLQVKQKKDEIFISHDKYVAEILRKFSLTEGKSASTPIDTEKSLLKDSDGEDVDVHTYRSMIGSLIGRHARVSIPDSLR
nr:hypothetical protein [Tanacetum cinerariifolium]